MKKIYLFLLACICASTTLFSQVDQETARSKFLTSDVVNKLKPTDVQSLRITSDHVSSISGIHHYYFMQEYQGIGIFNAVGSAHFNTNADLIQSHADFQGKLSFRISSTTPKINASQAILLAAKQMKYKSNKNLEQIENIGTVEQQQLFVNSDISKRDIPAKLMYQPMPNGEIRLAWDISILEITETNWWSMRVDAETGDILHKNNWMVSCNFDHDHANEAHKCKTHTNTDKSLASTPVTPSYNVYAMPLQSPADGNRTIEVDPADPTASPFGWHDTDGAAGAEFTITRGNNAHAYEDGNNAGFSPDGTASLTFDFPMDTTYSGGTESEAAAITNLFYWNNVIHDVWYHYGFTEAAGNFQENNYGNGGSGSDYVFAEAQDGSGTCNANFGTPNDGGNPTMQMYICGSRDGDLDNLVVVHEYGHGISNRLTGGGGNTSCLNNGEQMGEGWSDFLGMMMQIQAGDSGIDPFGVGTWLIGEPIGGPGIRTFPYSTDMTINSHTYGDVVGAVAPHGVGSVWCMMLWEMTWALIDQEGFDPDFYFGTGGNNIAMKLVMEGMKLQPCSPGFVDGRDAILLADQNLYGGQYRCLIWDAFAKRGLGVSADQGSSGSKTDGTEAFDTPGSLSLDKEVDKLVAGPGDTLTYTLTMKNSAFCNLKISNLVITDTLPQNTFYVASSASNGGSESGGVVSFPAIDTLFPGDSIVRTFAVYIDPSYTLALEFKDDMETGTGNWSTSSTGSNNWALSGASTHSGANAWFAADVAPSEDQFLQLTNPFTATASSVLSFWHSYDTEATWDGGVVQYSTDGGTTWLDLGARFTKNGYNSTIDNNSSKLAFSGNSGGYIESRADLSSFAGQALDLRFWMSCDAAVTGLGWYIDDVGILANFVDNTAYATADGGISRTASLETPTTIQYLQCLNGIQDGDETGIDCGGTFCPPCVSCTDSIQNGMETGIDCGGPDCPVCPTCTDGIQNGMETDVDCGGPDCPACPTCVDGIQNGMETGIDCGGPDCPVCPTCEDGIQNGMETGVDCGGPDCDPCPCLGNDLTLSITFDDYPQETSWELRDTAGSLLYAGGTYPNEPGGSTITFDFCIPDDCYKFYMYDSFGDGMCCSFGNGSYTLINNDDSTILATGGDFDDVDSTAFCVMAPPMSQCDSLLALHGIIAAGVYHALDVVNSDGLVQSPDTVAFKAGTEINLNQNFEVEMGADFEASIEACTSAMNLIRAKKKAANTTLDKSAPRE